jgi:hypothetical protein
MSLLVEMVMDGRVDGDKFPQTSHPPKSKHGPLSSSKWPLFMVCKQTTVRQRVWILGSIVEPAAGKAPIALPFISKNSIKERRELVVQDHKGRQIGDIRKAWSNATKVAVQLAAAKGIKLNFDGVTPHTLKHTAITWALQNGANTWDTAGYFSTSIETIEKVYAHHSPDHQKSAAEALNRRK